MRVDEDGDARIDLADRLHDPGVSELREALAPVLARRRHAENAQVAEAEDDLWRDSGGAVDRGGVDRLGGEAAQLSERLLQCRLLLRPDLRIREDEVRLEVTEKQALREAQVLRPGEQNLLRLLLLLLDLRGRQRHGFLPPGR